MHSDHYPSMNLKELQEQLENTNPVDLAEQFRDLSTWEIAVRIKLMSKDQLADTFALLDPDQKLELIEALSDDNIRSLMKELDEDEVVDTLQELPANMVSKLMTYYIDEGRRPVINELLGYPEESVGSVMTVNFVWAKESLTLPQMLQKVQESTLDADKLEQIWITDNARKLLGFIHLADLLRYPDSTVDEQIRPITRTVHPLDDQEVLARLVSRYDLSEVPVVDSEERLIGTVPVEWAVDVMADEYEEDWSNIHGITEGDDDGFYLESSNLQLAKKRTTWLIICLLTATFTGFIMRSYEAVLAVNVSLAAYIPMLMDSGGNAGSQASTTIIQALYKGEVKVKDALKVLWKEMRLGLTVGAVLVAVNVLRMAIFSPEETAVVLTVSISLLITIVLSNVIGGLLPIVAEVLHIDPTVMAGPMITTVVDTIVLFVYFEIASQLMGI